MNICMEQNLPEFLQESIKAMVEVWEKIDNGQKYLRIVRNDNFDITRLTEEEILLRTKLQNIFSNFDEDKIDYIVYCIEDLAGCSGMGQEEAIEYLKQYKGFEYYDEFYEILHTLSFEDTVESLLIICRKNGGQLPHVQGS